MFGPQIPAPEVTMLCIVPFRRYRRDGRIDVVREFGYEDFRNRMS